MASDNTAEVINLDHYRRVTTQDSTAPFISDPDEIAKATPPPNKGLIDPARLYEGIEATDSASSLATLRLYRSLSLVNTLLEQTHYELNAGRITAADTTYMRAKNEIRTLLPFLEISDGIGMVLWELIRTCDPRALVNEPNDRIYVIKTAVRQLLDFPNMSYDHALRITSSLETVNSHAPLPGLEAIQDILFDHDEN